MITSYKPLLKKLGNKSISVLTVLLSVIVSDSGVKFVVDEGCEGVIDIFTHVHEQLVLDIVFLLQEGLIGSTSGASGGSMLCSHLQFLIVLQELLSSLLGNSLVDGLGLLGVVLGGSLWL